MRFILILPFMLLACDAGVLTVDNGNLPPSFVTSGTADVPGTPDDPVGVEPQREGPRNVDHHSTRTRNAA